LPRQVRMVGWSGPRSPRRSLWRSCWARPRSDRAGPAARGPARRVASHLHMIESQRRLGDRDPAPRQPRIHRTARLAPARSWICPSSQSCLPVSTAGTVSGVDGTASRRSTPRACATSCGCCCAHPMCSYDRFRGSRRNAHSTEGNDLGVPARVFPQWLRCTGCVARWPRTVRLLQHSPVPDRSRLL
jgi:hypothetical protein